MNSWPNLLFKQSPPGTPDSSFPLTEVSPFHPRRDPRQTPGKATRPSADIDPYLAVVSLPLLQVRRNLQMPSGFLGNICMEPMEENCKMNKPLAQVTPSQAVSKAQAGLKLCATDTSLDLLILFKYLRLPSCSNRQVLCQTSGVPNSLAFYGQTTSARIPYIPTCLPSCPKDGSFF